MNEKPIEYLRHDVHFFLLVQGEVLYRKLQIVIIDDKDRELAKKSVISYQRAFSLMADDGVCYNSETYFNDFFSEFVTNTSKTSIVDFDGTYPKWQTSDWEGFIPVNNDRTDFYYIGINNKPVLYKKGVDY